MADANSTDPRRTGQDEETPIALEVDHDEGDDGPIVIPVELRIPTEFAGKPLRLEIDLTFED